MLLERSNHSLSRRILSTLTDSDQLNLSRRTENNTIIFALFSSSHRDHYLPPALLCRDDDRLRQWVLRPKYHLQDVSLLVHYLYALIVNIFFLPFSETINPVDSFAQMWPSQYSDRISFCHNYFFGPRTK